MAVTIKDIAKKVGVNPSTVSRVINGNSSISEETKRKILKAMEELDYHPNIMGRSLVNGSTFTIGLVIDAGNVDAFSNTFFIQSVAAIEIVAEKQGYNLLITNDTNGKNQSMVKNLVLGHKVDGIILPSASITADLMDLLITNHFPFIVMGEFENPPQGTVWVDMDNEEGAKLAVDHLLKQGYSRPALIIENEKNMFEKKRICGFQSAVKELINTIKEPLQVECGQQAESADICVDFLLNELPDCDSIICSNNIIAFKVLRTLKLRNIKVPEQIGIVTFDNYPLAEYMDPPLTVIDVDTYRLGEKSAEMLFELIRGKGGTENIQISTHIIARQSTQKEGVLSD